MPKCPPQVPKSTKKTAKSTPRVANWRPKVPQWSPKVTQSITKTKQALQSATTTPKYAPRCQKTSKHTQTKTTNQPNKQRGAEIKKTLLAFVCMLSVPVQPRFIGSASAAELCFAYALVANMGIGLIWYAGLDSRRNLAVECISQKSVCLILRFACF